MIEKHAKLVHAERWKTNPVGMADLQVLEALVRAGYFAQLNHAGARVLNAMLVFAERGRATISLRGLARYSGVVSRTAIVKSLQQFSKDGLLQIIRSKVGDARAVSTYVFTFENRRFQALLSELHQTQKNEAESQRKLQEEYRASHPPTNPATPPKSKPFVLSDDHPQSQRSSERTAQLEEGKYPKEWNGTVQ